MRNALKSRLYAGQGTGQRGIDMMQIVIWMFVFILVAGLGIIGYNYYQDSARGGALQSMVRDTATAATATYTMTGNWPTIDSSGVDGFDEETAGQINNFLAEHESNVISLEYDTDDRELRVAAHDGRISDDGNVAWFEGRTGQAAYSKDGESAPGWTEGALAGGASGGTGD